MSLAMGSLEEGLAVEAVLGFLLPLGPPEILRNISKL